MSGNILGSLNSAASGLQAAQLGIEVTGQNIANATTTGYVREQVDLESVGAPAQVGLFAGSAAAGQGVRVAGVVPLGSSLLDAQARTASAAAGYSGARADGLSQLESTLGEPGGNALSGTLSAFWSAWQDVSNQPGAEAPVAALLGRAGTLVGQITSAYGSMQQQWSQTAQDVASSVAQVNRAAAQVAQLNGQIRATVRAGGDANALIVQRSTLTSTLATLTGATVVQNADDTVSVNIGGAGLVQGTTARSLQVTGSATLEGAAGSPAGVEWSDGAGPVGFGTGRIAGELTLLAPATPQGNGGALAETAEQLNTLASNLATQVNAVSATGTTASGATSVAFFGMTAGVPAALGLSVLPTDASGVAVAAPGAGASDGSIADAISLLGTGPNSPDAAWSTAVVALGTLTQAQTQQAALDETAQATASQAQSSQESVSLDQENMNLVAYQHAYEGSARVLTTLDAVLDQLINHTGLVGLG